MSGSSLVSFLQREVIFLKSLVGVCHQCLACVFRAHTVTEPQYHTFTNWEFVCVALRCVSWLWTVNPPIWFAVFKVLICRFDSFTKPTLAAMFIVHISQDYSVSLLLFASVIQMRLSAVSLSHDSDLWPYQSYDSHTKCRVRLLNIHVKFNIHFTQNALQTRKGLSINFIAFKRITKTFRDYHTDVRLSRNVFVKVSADIIWKSYSNATIITLIRKQDFH